MFSTQVQSVIDKVNRLRDTVDDHWQIPSDEALVLAQLIRIGRCTSICEIGASYGYSTLHLAAAASEQGGRVVSLEIDPRKVQETTRHLEEAGLSAVATVKEGDARETLKNLPRETRFDFVFIDAWKDQSFEYLEAVRPLLAPNAILVTDNTSTHESELAPFVEHLRSQPDLISVSVPIGNGFELSYRRPEKPNA